MEEDEHAHVVVVVVMMMVEVVEVAEGVIVSENAVAAEVVGESLLLLSYPDQETIVGGRT